MAQEIPLTSDTSQSFLTDLDGVNYNFLIIWNERVGIWTLSIYDVDMVAIIEGVPLLLGSDILEKYILGIGGMIVLDTDGTNVDATSEDLGTRVRLYYLTPDEVENGITV